MVYPFGTSFVVGRFIDNRLAVLVPFRIRYFQKLSKAKPGEMSLLNHHFAMPACASDPMSLSQPGTGNARKSKHNAKRDSMAKMAVAPSLKPYLTLPGVGSVQAGLYKFLSPVVVDGKPVQELTSELVAHASAAAAATATAEAAVAAAAAAETALEEKPTAAVDKPTATASTPVEPDTGDSGAVSVPEWYAHGDGVKALLVQSESLDWAADSGGDALPIYNKVPKPKVTKAKTAAKAAKEAAAAEQAATLAAAAEAPVENVPPKQQRGGKRGGGGERTAKSRKTKGSSPPSVAVNFAPFDSDSGVGSDMMSGSVDFVPQGGMSLSCSSLVSELNELHALNFFRARIPFLNFVACCVKIE